MRMAMFFRRGPERKPRAKLETVPLPRDWSVRDWTDLPPYFPRNK